MNYKLKESETLQDSRLLSLINGHLNFTTKMNSENLVASLCVSIKSGNVAEVERVLQLGVDPNSPSSDWARSRPLILAAASGHPDILAALLAHPDLDPNLADGMFGNTALIDASHTGNTDVVRALIQDPRCMHTLLRYVVYISLLG